MEHEAYCTLQTVRRLAAFSIPGAQRRKLNQHATRYTFADGSHLFIYANGRGESVRPDGLRDCVSALRVTDRS